MARALLAYRFGPQGPEAYVGALVIADFITVVTGFLQSLGDK